jgi:hypothetical protein
MTVLKDRNPFTFWEGNLHLLLRMFRERLGDVSVMVQLSDQNPRRRDCDQVDAEGLAIKWRGAALVLSALCFDEGVKSIAKSAERSLWSQWDDHSNFSRRSAFDGLTCDLNVKDFTFMASVIHGGGPPQC